MRLSRRQLLLSGLAAGSALGLAMPARATALLLRAGPLDHSILPGLVTRGMMSFAPDGPAPVLRLKQGQPAQIAVENALDEVTTVHWHGVRVPNDQDGVPYLTQFPIGVGETYTYRFTPADAGTYWYHPHCNTFAQISRGMTGVLIVEEAEDPGFDADIALNVRDFRLGEDGAFLDLSIPRNAARGGTLGTVSTANWQVDGVTTVPAGGLVRLRLAVTDVTRIYALSVTGAAAVEVVALDGHPLATPLTGGDVRLAPGQRADLALVMPEAGEVQVLMTLGGGKTRPLARLRAGGAALGRSLAGRKPLPQNPVAEPDLASAEVLDFTLGWTPEGAPATSSVCGDTPLAFWSINRKVWPGDVADPGAPIATLELGRTYVFRLRNETQNSHPIHLHGMAFRVLGREGGFTDTVLLDAHQTVDIAVVADNPGDWVLHCHVIEHQKTGLAAYVRVR
jgi:FtsP/CotA-like multicopper oxidase with cupredoxin domain